MQARVCRIEKRHSKYDCPLNFFVFASSRIVMSLRAAKRLLKKPLAGLRQAYYKLSGSNPVQCNICQYRGKQLHSDDWHLYTICPKCESQVRHRLLWASLTLLPDTNLQKIIADKDVLHFAPEHILRPLLRKSAGQYRTADLLAEGYNYEKLDILADISDMKAIGDASYDCVIACDVLEHVPDHLRAIREMHRVLRPNGYCILTVPQKDGLEKTYEDLSITDPIQRQNTFGQRDHLRIYGNDFAQILQRNGFEVTVVDEKNFPDAVAKRFVLYPPVLSKHPLATNHRKIFFGRKCAA